MKKLWGGRFSKGLAPAAEPFMASIAFDQRLAVYDIKGSLAHVQTLAKAKVVTPAEAKKITKGLLQILQEVKAGKFVFQVQDEDVHLAIEKKLIQKIGKAGAKLHTARSRNDQVALDLRLYLRDKILSIITKVKNVQMVLVGLGQKNLQAVMPGMTHLQPAQPVLFSHHLLAYFEMLERDKERLSDSLKRVNVMPLGSGALAGVGYKLDRNFTAKLLGFPKVTANSLDAVSDRDFVVEFLADASLLMAHCSRLCEELILWSNPAFQFIELDDSLTTGSSMLPQKKNPDLAELLRAKTGRVYGHLMSLLTVLKALPLAYNKDLQEDKEALFDACDTLENGLPLFGLMLKTMKVNSDKMAAACDQGYILAVDAADYLVKKGMPFREAHELTGKIVKDCLKSKMTFSDLTITEWKAYSPLFGDDVMDKVSLSASIHNKVSLGGTAPASVKKALAEVWKRLKAF